MTRLAASSLAAALATLVSLLPRPGLGWASSALRGLVAALLHDALAAAGRAVTLTRPDIYTCWCRGCAAFPARGEYIGNLQSFL